MPSIEVRSEVFPAAVGGEDPHDDQAVVASMTIETGAWLPQDGEPADRSEWRGFPALRFIGVEGAKGAHVSQTEYGDVEIRFDESRLDAAIEALISIKRRAAVAREALAMMAAAESPEPPPAGSGAPRASIDGPGVPPRGRLAVTRSALRRSEAAA